MAADVTLPPGFVIDQPTADLPPGFKLDAAPAAAAPSRLSSTLFNVGRGLLTGGPLGMAAAGVGEGMKGLEEASDIAGGAVTDAMASVSGRRSLLNPFAVEVPAEVSGALGAATKVGIPALVGGISGGSTGKPLMEGGARRVMQSALKPSSKALANGDAAKAIDTMLREGVNVTPGGAAKLRQLITKLKGELGATISQHPGALVDKAHVYRELSSTLDDVSKLGRPNEAMDAVRTAWETFKNHPLAKGEKIPASLAQDMKQATQRAVKDAYGRITTTPVDDKIDMAIATGLRKGVEEAVPGTGAINAKLSEYINALHQIEPRAAMAANRDLGGLVPLANSPEAAMLMLADRNPWMKSYVARVLHQGRTLVPGGAGATGAAAQGGQ